MSVAGPITRFEPHLAVYAPMVVEAARRVSAQLGYRG